MPNEMLSLRRLQRALATSICAPDPFAHTIASLSVPGGVEARDRLAVYQSGYPARVRDALLESYPALAHVVGQAHFVALVRRYIQTRRPAGYNLNDAGAELAAFLGDDTLRHKFPFVADLAELEWAITQVFHAAPTDRFDPTSVAHWAVDQWADACIDLQPCTIVRSQWPILQIWEARHTAIAEIDIDLGKDDIVLVRRSGWEIECESIGTTEAFVLTALQRGRTLGEVADGMEEAGFGAESVTAHFARWVHDGLIANVRGSAARS